MASYADEVRQNLIAIFGEDFEELPGTSASSGPLASSGPSSSFGPLASSGPSTSSSPSASSSYQAVELVQIRRLADDEDAEIDSDEEFLDANVDDSDGSTSATTSDESDIENSAQDGPVGEDWTLHRRGPRPPVFTSREEVRVENVATPFDFFKLLFSQDILEQIVCSTNQCANELLSHCSTSQARIRRWTPLTVEKLLTFLGILFHMGSIKVNRYSDYWRKHYLYNLFSCQFMAKNVFLLIFRCLRFGQHNLDSLIAYFNNRMVELYSPGEQLSIDESIILSRGRSGIRQYIKGKRHKYGIKLYMLATPSGLSLKIHLYKGKRDQDVGGKGHTDKVVAKLLENYFGTGRHVYMDNFYNSVGLSEFLLRNGTNVTGTLRAKRKGNPAVIANKLAKGGSIFRYNRSGICVCKWRDQRDVLTISTTHSPELKPVTNRRGQQILKPEMVTQYNLFMSGVDRQDQMLAYYTCEHKSMRWYKKVGIHIFQMMMLNAYYLYKIKLNKKIDFYKFREEIITNLLPPPPNGSVQVNGSGQASETFIHLPVHLPKDSNRNTKRRRCKHCWDTTKKRVNTLCYCPTCHNQPGLCLECFRAYHKY